MSSFNWPHRGASTPWAPTDKSGSIVLLDSLHVVKDGSNNITQFTDQSPNGYNVNCTVSCTPATGGTPLWVDNQLNGQPCARMDHNSGGRFSGTCSPLSGPAIIAPNQPMGLTWVHKGPVLADDKYTSLAVISGGTAATSVTFYFTAANMGSTFRWQYGNGYGPSHNEAIMIGNADAFDISQYHYGIFNYNGAGDPTNPDNYRLTVNGIPLALTSFQALGSNEAYNWFGNHGDPPTDVSLGDNFCFYMYDSMITGHDLTGLKQLYSTRYAL